jgi:hypothetical protein
VNKIVPGFVRLPGAMRPSGFCAISTPAASSRSRAADHLTGIEIDIGDSNTATVKVIASSKVTVVAPEVDVSNGGTLQPVKLADGSNSTVLKAQ